MFGVFWLFPLLASLSLAAHQSASSNIKTSALDVSLPVCEHVNLYKDAISRTFGAFGKYGRGAALVAKVAQDKALGDAFVIVKTQSASLFRYGIKVYDFEPNLVALCVEFWAQDIMNRAKEKRSLSRHLSDLLTLNAVMSDILQYYREHAKNIMPIRSDYLKYLETVVSPVSLTRIARDFVVVGGMPAMPFATMLTELDLIAARVEDYGGLIDSFFLDLVEVYVVLVRPKGLEPQILERWISCRGAERVGKFKQFLNMTWDLVPYTPLATHDFDVTVPLENLLHSYIVFDSSSVEAMKKTFKYTFFPPSSVPTTRHPSPSQLALIKTFKKEIYDKHLVSFELAPMHLMVSASATEEDATTVVMAQIILFRFGLPLFPINIVPTDYDAHNEAIAKHNIDELRVSAAYLNIFMIPTMMLKALDFRSHFHFTIYIDDFMPHGLCNLLKEAPKYASALNYLASGDYYGNSEFRILVENVLEQDKLEILQKSLDDIDGDCELPTVVFRIGKFENCTSLVSSFISFCETHLCANGCIVLSAKIEFVRE